MSAISGSRSPRLGAVAGTASRYEPCLRAGSDVQIVFVSKTSGEDVRIWLADRMLGSSLTTIIKGNAIHVQV
jgi:hypothetical protein